MRYFGASTMIIWAAFHRRLQLDLGERQGFGLDALEHPEAEFLMGHFAATEAQDELDLVALVEEAAHGLHLRLVIMVVNAGTQLDFLDLDDLLLLAGLGGLFLLVETEFSVIENFADRRIGVGDDFHQIEPVFFRQAQSFDNVDHPAILAFRIDQPGNSRPAKSS